MKRDPRLRGLSDDHHQALVLGRQLLLALEAGDCDGIAERIQSRFDDELAPHFEVEEQVLVPAMQTSGLRPLAERLLDEHDQIRAAVQASSAGDLEASASFAQLLIAHVRFEERVLFPAIEGSLSGDVLDAVARLAPWPGRS